MTALNVGTVTITNVTCGPDPTFTLTSGAQLGSEVSGPTIPMHGRITYPAPPPGPALGPGIGRGVPTHP